MAHLSRHEAQRELFATNNNLPNVNIPRKSMNIISFLSKSSKRRAQERTAGQPSASNAQSPVRNVLGNDDGESLRRADSAAHNMVRDDIHMQGKSRFHQSTGQEHVMDPPRRSEFRVTRSQDSTVAAEQASLASTNQHTLSGYTLRQSQSGQDSAGSENMSLQSPNQESHTDTVYAARMMSSCAPLFLPFAPGIEATHLFAVQLPYHDVNQRAIQTAPTFFPFTSCADLGAVAGSQEVLSISPPYSSSGRSIASVSPGTRAPVSSPARITASAQASKHVSISNTAHWAKIDLYQCTPGFGSFIAISGAREVAHLRRLSLPETSVRVASFGADEGNGKDGNHLLKKIREVMQEDKAQFIQELERVFTNSEYN